ncbi:hypothetical protein evm_000784 [Chilo suppressalis]|nr:hypothetical protein evm_000784 [Chilo suppressalis]
MFSCGVVTVLLLYSVSIFASKNVEGSQPVLQKTVEELFTQRSPVIHPGACKILPASRRQSKICKRNSGLANVLETAKGQAINACEETFKYDRWNCSVVFNGNPKKKIFNKIYRETAFVNALIAASIAHAVAKACASGDLTKCTCVGSFGKNANFTWKNNGCGDDFKQGQRVAKNFLDFKHAGNDQIADILKQDVLVGIDSIGEQMKEVCKCHGFSGSCTTKTCWKRLGPFQSAMGSLKKHYHHAIKKKIINYTTKRAISPKIRKRLKVNRKELVFLQKTPNLCVSTRGRVCKDRHNCATLCCGRGFVTTKRTVKSRCRCKMVNCCYVQCDTCVEEVDQLTAADAAAINGLTCLLKHGEARDSVGSRVKSQKEVESLLLDIGLPQGVPNRSVLRYPYPTASCDLHQIVGPSCGGLPTLVSRYAAATRGRFHSNGRQSSLQCALSFVLLFKVRNSLGYVGDLSYPADLMISDSITQSNLDPDLHCRLDDFELSLLMRTIVSGHA